jgi:hypothetical protein
VLTCCDYCIFPFFSFGLETIELNVPLVLEVACIYIATGKHLWALSELIEISKN